MISLRTYCSPLFLVLAVCAIFSQTSFATETDRGVIRKNSITVCLNHCDDYYLQLDDSSGTLILNGLDLPLFVNAHVEVTGARGACNACPVLHVTNITRLPTVEVVEENNELPRATELQQNYPNPFNPATKLQIAISNLSSLGGSASGGQMVTLVVYNVLGQQVSTLINNELHPGTYTVSWDASKYASGVYYYRLQTQNYVSVKKMLLLR